MVLLVVLIVILLIICCTVHYELVYSDNFVGLLCPFGQTPGGQYIEESSEVFLQIICKSAFPDHPNTIDRM